MTMPMTVLTMPTTNAMIERLLGAAHDQREVVAADVVLAERVLTQANPCRRGIGDRLRVGAPPG